MNQTPKPSRWKRPSRWITLFFIALAVAGFLAFRVASGSGVKQEVEAIRQRGLPVTARQLDDWYKRVPATNNAALAFINAYGYHVASAARNDPNNSKTPLRPGEPLNPELADAVTLYLEQNNPTLEAIHAAAQLTASRYPVDLSKGFATLLPHLPHVKRMAQLLKWDAIHKSEKGERKAALRSLHSGFALAASLRHEPILISELVRIASLTIIMQAVERVVSQHPLTEEELVALSHSTRQAEEYGKESLRRAFIGERAGGIPLFDLNYRGYVNLGTGGTALPSNTGSEIFKAALFNLRRALGVRDRDLRFYLECMNLAEKAVEQDFPEMLRLADEAQDVVEKGLKSHPIKYSLSSLLLSDFSNAMKKEAYLTGRLRCARMALAIERYRLAHAGKLPSAHELAPTFIDELPRDPLDDQPLRYEVNKGKGYRILSAAATAEFRKGTTSTNLTDVAFTVLR